MSIDVLIITPEEYSLELFFNRAQERFTVYFSDSEYIQEEITIEYEDRAVWMCTWENSFSTLEDEFNENQVKAINEIHNPKFYCMTGDNNDFLFPILEAICNDPKVLICSDYSPVCRGYLPDFICRGDEFAELIKRGVKP